MTETIIESSPFDGEMIPAKSKQRVVRRVPTQAEFRALVQEIRKPQWKKENKGKDIDKAESDYRFLLGLSIRSAGGSGRGRSPETSSALFATMRFRHEAEAARHVAVVFALWAVVVHSVAGVEASGR